MLRRLLNIASIVCLVFCVALMGMWVWSYTWTDEFGFNRLGDFSVGGGSAIGRIAIAKQIVRGVGPELNFPVFTHRPVAALGSELAATDERWSAVAGFGIVNNVDAFGIMMPYWFLVLTAGLLAMAFQLRWPMQFTLRSLFIATTFVAIVLGMIAWLDRAWIGH